MPGDVGGWQFLCLEHVRAFNAGYNYFDGLTPDEVYAAQSPLAGWEKEAVRGGRTAFTFGDPHGLFTADSKAAAGPAAEPPKNQPGHTPGRWAGRGDAQALGMLGLDRSAGAVDIRAAYRLLVRRYHPDTNGGDRSHEGKLQAVVSAFTHLKATREYQMESKQP